MSAISAKTAKCLSNNIAVNQIENAFSALLDDASDFLILREFTDCVSVCKRGVELSKLHRDHEKSGEYLEQFSVIIIQAFAELECWQEALPFITDVYSKIQAYPPTIVQLLVLLHAKVEDYDNCDRLVLTWLAHHDNQHGSGYSCLINIYMARVLSAQEKWDDVSAFLDSCVALAEENKEAIQKFANDLRDSHLQKVATSIPVQENECEMHPRESADVEIDELLQEDDVEGESDVVTTSSEAPGASRKCQIKNAAENQTGMNNDKATGKMWNALQFIRRVFLLFGGRLRFLNMSILSTVLFIVFSAYLIGLHTYHGTMLTDWRNVTTVWSSAVHSIKLLFSFIF